MSLSGIDCPEVASHHVLVAPADLGHQIRRARESRGWNQQDLADALTRQRGGRRVGVRSVGRWERGETVPRNAIGALEAVLGIGLNGTGEQTPFVPADDDEARIWAMDEPEEWRRKLIAWKRAGVASRSTG